MNIDVKRVYRFFTSRRDPVVIYSTHYTPASRTTVLRYEYTAEELPDYRKRHNYEAVIKTHRSLHFYIRMGFRE